MAYYISWILCSYIIPPSFPLCCGHVNCSLPQITSEVQEQRWIITQRPLMTASHGK